MLSFEFWTAPQTHSISTQLNSTSMCIDRGRQRETNPGSRGQGSQGQSILGKCTESLVQRCLLRRSPQTRGVYSSNRSKYQPSQTGQGGTGCVSNFGSQFCPGHGRGSFAGFHVESLDVWGSGECIGGTGGRIGGCHIGPTDPRQQRHSSGTQNDGQGIAAGRFGKGGNGYAGFDM
eukprot:scaffold22939_cov49-Attheya_sp.AAC.6